MNPDLILIGFCALVLGALFLFGLALILTRLKEMQRQLLWVLQHLHKEDWQ